MKDFNLSWLLNTYGSFDALLTGAFVTDVTVVFCWEPNLRTIYLELFDARNRADVR